VRSFKTKLRPHMFAKNIYVERRQKLINNMHSGLLLFLGNTETGMNYADNTYHFRQDSTFLYYFGMDQPDLAAIIDLDENRTIVFGNELSLDHIVWMGPQTTIRQQAENVGISETLPFGDLKSFLEKPTSVGRTIHYLPPYRDRHHIQLHSWLKTDLSKIKENASVEFIQAVVAQRSIKSAEEIAEMTKAVNTTREMHMSAMRMAREGMTEAQLTGEIQRIATAGGGTTSYPVILTVNGQTLHNHYHGNVIKEGQLILGDFGAETAMHYAGDITRTFPVSKKFTSKQKDIYNIVLKAEDDCIASLRPGLLYRDAHLQAATTIMEGLKSVGLMKGNMEDALREGAFGLFFPHGLGHMIGLDVHDMENLGEQYVGYRDGLNRSSMFGLAYLRLAKELQEGYVLTVEPGIYFIPELISQWKADGKCSEFINYDKVEQYLDFGGIRIEDNCLITADGYEVLGDRIPKTVEEVEALRAS